MPRSIPIESEEHWKGLRRSRIGASDSAALFGLSKYTTAFELFHRLRGTLPPVDLSEEERVICGHCLEAGIARAASIIHQLRLRKVRRYLVHSRIEGMGASLDYEALTEDGWVPAEIKNIDIAIWRDEWLHDGLSGTHEPPPHIDIQLQHQCAVAEALRGMLIACVGGNRIHVVERPALPKVMRAIEDAAEGFLARVRDNDPPPPDYDRDLAAMQLVLLTAEGSVDKRGDERLAAMIAEYRRALAEAKAGEQAKERVRAEILEHIDGAASVVADGGRISARLVAAKPQRTVVYKPQPEHRELRVYFNKLST
jgi:predicted phage-related endonuclease